VSKPTKSSLSSKLRKAGIPIPKTASIADMQHRLDHWIPGEGWLVRLLRASSRMPEHPISLLSDKDTMYWIPNSQMAKEIIESRLVLVVSRTAKPSNDATVVDVPRDYAERWGNGSNDKSNS
tara:strand:+ start:12163 stop:12528 length:366 start_codon:yes stop_codon:yes gene_type:complete